jgi:hypothetical protein
MEDGSKASLIAAVLERSNLLFGLGGALYGFLLSLVLVFPCSARAGVTHGQDFAV